MCIRTRSSLSYLLLNDSWKIQTRFHSHITTPLILLFEAARLIYVSSREQLVVVPSELVVSHALRIIAEVIRPALETLAAA